MDANQPDNHDAHVIIDHAQIYDKLASVHGISNKQVQAFANLYDDGASVPFIARYRKEQTGGLDDAILRELEKTLTYERDMARRRAKIVELLQTQGVLNADLQARLDSAQTKLALEEIYQPYRPKRRTLSAKAGMAGLDKAAQAILAGADIDEALSDFVPVTEVTDDLGEVVAVDFSTRELQLAGVQAILMDQWATELELLDAVRIGFAKTANVTSRLVGEEKREAGEKFKDYFEHSEPLHKITSHRLLAMLRGRQLNVLSIHVDGEDDPFVTKIQQKLVASAHPAQAFLNDTAARLWHDKWRPQIEHRLLTEQRLAAQSDAIDIFAQNLHHLLMAAPAGRKVILGVDPGIRHGVKMAVIDDKGDVLDTKTVYPFAPDNKVDEAKSAIRQLIQAHSVTLVAVGNGTASRETDELIKDVINEHKLSATAVMVSEAGASVYSASELASDELGDLDVSLRGAVSIARRLQDPLSELVKVEPKAIGVGQYQHDVNQTELENSLNKVTEDCVNAVGVDVNTASAAILSHIAGLNKNVAAQIVAYRRANGAFDNREQLKNVPRLGSKTFEQAAGFLRIKDGDEPLDATGVHPESYGFVYEILARAGKSLDEVLGNETLAKSLNDSQSDYSQTATVLAELAKPAHDPRGEFRTANFREDVNSIKDLTLGMTLEGVVTNVTAFGCFVDIGVHQEGLVHISHMADKFIDNPASIVKPQDIVSVQVISIDEARGRIGLSMKKIPNPSQGDAKKAPSTPRQKKTTKKSEHPKDQTKTQHKKSPTKEYPAKVGSFGALLKKAGL